MKKIIFIILVILNFGCAKDISYIETSLAPYVDTFLVESKAYGHNFSTSNFSAVFLDLPEGTAGTCRTAATKYADGTKYHQTMKIDKEFWAMATESAREFLVFHEMGHCMMDYGHSSASRFTVILMDIGNEQPFNGQVLTDYMVDFIFPLMTDKVYAKLRPYYIEQFFTGESSLMDPYLPVSKISASQKSQAFSLKSNGHEWSCDHPSHK